MMVIPLWALSLLFHRLLFQIHSAFVITYMCSNVIMMFCNGNSVSHLSLLAASMYNGHIPQNPSFLQKHWICPLHWLSPTIDSEDPCDLFASCDQKLLSWSRHTVMNFIHLFISGLSPQVTYIIHFSSILYLNQPMRLAMLRVYIGPKATHITSMDVLQRRI